MKRVWKLRYQTGLVDPCAIQFRSHLASHKTREIYCDTYVSRLAIEVDSPDLRRLSYIQSQRYQRRLDLNDEQMTRDTVLKLCTYNEQGRYNALKDANEAASSASEAAFSAAAEAQRSAYSCPLVEIPRYEESYKLPSGMGIVTGSLLAPCGVHYTPTIPSPDNERVDFKKERGLCSIS